MACSFPQSQLIINCQNDLNLYNEFEYVVTQAQTMGDEQQRPRIVIKKESIQATTQNGERLVITAADLFPRAAKYPLEVLQQTPPKHPFEVEPLLQLLNERFQITHEQIASVIKPHISSNPDDLEIWETQQIVGRREQYPNEPIIGYLVRMLYEESFSVDQNPNAWSLILHKSSAGLTPGGLLSHFAQLGPSEDLQKILSTQPTGNTLQRAYVNWMTDPATGVIITDPTRIKEIESNFRELADAVIRITRSRDQGIGMDYFRINGFRILDHLKKYFRFTEKDENQEKTPPEQSENENKVIPREDLNSIGFRVIRLLASTPEFLNPVKDREFLTKLGVTHSTPLSVLQVQRMVWSRCQPLFGFVGSGRELGEVEENALRLLLEMRFHPEFQVFYRYFSPSGYFNETNENTVVGATKNED